MRIHDIFKNHKKIILFEVSPPKKDSTIENITLVLGDLSKLHLDFISAMYGSGGNTADSSTCQIIHNE